ALKYFGDIPEPRYLYCYLAQAPSHARLGLMSLLMLLFSLISHLNSVKLKYMDFLLQSAWAKNFGLAYLTHFILLKVFSIWKQEVNKVPYLFDIFVFLNVLLVEITMHLIAKIGKKRGGYSL
ncbi:MAG: hypothetical protein NZ480_09895, partial [Bdellovibrionaceae bacterium]|nr:hypothetical protein [Pseudobdellovibrionaceae bacterium]MDW8191007.1 hypothetical protein [Pseudobdellovibrionaceae bacterium]